MYRETNEEYWQGHKDGSRLMYGILTPATERKDMMNRKEVKNENII